MTFKCSISSKHHYGHWRLLIVVHFYAKKLCNQELKINIRTSVQTQKEESMSIQLFYSISYFPKSFWLYKQSAICFCDDSVFSQTLLYFGAIKQKIEAHSRILISVGNGINCKTMYFKFFQSCSSAQVKFLVIKLGPCQSVTYFIMSVTYVFMLNRFVNNNYCESILRRCHLGVQRFLIIML